MQGEAGAAGAPAPSSGKPVGRSSSLQEGCWPRAQKGRAQDKKMMSLSTDKVPGKAGKGAREAKGTGPESDHSHPPLGVSAWRSHQLDRQGHRKGLSPGADGASQVTYLLPGGSERTRVAIRTSTTLWALGAIFSSRTRGADLPLQVRKETVRENPPASPPPHDSQQPVWVREST